MSYFHVIVKRKGSTSNELIFADLTKDDLIRLFVNPYKGGTRFRSGQFIIDPVDISELRIVETTESEDVEREKLYQQHMENLDRLNRDSSVIFLPTPYGYSPEDIADAGEDVTQVLLSSQPAPKILQNRASFAKQQNDSIIPQKRSTSWMIQLVIGLVVTVVGGWILFKLKWN